MAPANNRGYSNVGPAQHSSSGGGGSGPAAHKRPPGASAAVREAWVHPARSTSVDSSRVAAAAAAADVEWGGGVELGRFEFGNSPLARYTGVGGHYRYHVADNGAHHQQRARDGHIFVKSDIRFSVEQETTK